MANLRYASRSRFFSIAWNWSMLIAGFFLAPFLGPKACERDLVPADSLQTVVLAGRGR